MTVLIVTIIYTHISQYVVRRILLVPDRWSMVDGHGSKIPNQVSSSWQAGILRTWEEQGDGVQDGGLIPSQPKRSRCAQSLLAAVYGCTSNGSMATMATDGGDELIYCMSERAGRRGLLHTEPG